MTYSTDVPRPQRLPPDRFDPGMTCQRKKNRTRKDAVRFARGRGLYAYPCPFSRNEQHWHVTSDPPSSSSKFYENIQQSALAAGGMGYPEGWVARQIRPTGVARKGVSQCPG